MQGEVLAFRPPCRAPLSSAISSTLCAAFSEPLIIRSVLIPAVIYVENVEVTTGMKRGRRELLVKSYSSTVALIVTLHNNSCDVIPLASFSQRPNEDLGYESCIKRRELETEKQEPSWILLSGAVEGWSRDQPGSSLFLVKYAIIPSTCMASLTFHL